MVQPNTRVAEPGSLVPISVLNRGRRVPNHTAIPRNSVVNFPHFLRYIHGSCSPSQGFGELYNNVDRQRKWILPASCPLADARGCRSRPTPAANHDDPCVSNLPPTNYYPRNVI